MKKIILSFALSSLILTACTASREVKITQQTGSSSQAQTTVDTGQSQETMGSDVSEGVAIESESAVSVVNEVKLNMGTDLESISRDIDDTQIEVEDFSDL